MEEQGHKAIRAFDSAYTTNKMQMLKILFSHIAPESKGIFAVYIKLMELQYTFSMLKFPNKAHFSHDSNLLASDFFGNDNEGTIELLEELLPFSNSDERKRIEQMKQMMQNMKQAKEMMDMIQMMREMFPEGAGGDGGMNPMDLFSAMGGDGGINPMDLFSSMSAFNTSSTSD